MHSSGSNQSAAVGAAEKHFAATALHGLFLSPNGAVKEPGYTKARSWDEETARTILTDEAGRTTFRAFRSFGESAPFWLATETRHDEQGRSWWRDFDMVVDNFGDLVEVQS